MNAEELSVSMWSNLRESLASFGVELDELEPHGENIPSVDTHGEYPPPASKGGRPPLYGADHWQAVAKVYDEACQLQMNPRQAVANHWSKPLSTAGRWVLKARKAGYLPPTLKGVSRGNDSVNVDLGRKYLDAMSAPLVLTEQDQEAIRNLLT